MLSCHAMRRFCAITLLLSIQKISFSADLSPAQQEFAADLAQKFQTLEKSHTHAVAGIDGWLFLPSELRFLSVGEFWGKNAVKVSRATKPEDADPLPAIVDFHEQLKKRGIELLLVPVPPKAAVYPEKIVPQFNPGEDAAPFLHRFSDELRSRGVDVLDLTPIFLQHRDSERGEAFCKTDTHWSGYGCVLAAERIAERVREKLKVQATQDSYSTEWQQIEITGDLAQLLPSNSAKPGPERIQVRNVSEKSGSGKIQSDLNSPLLLLGDSYTLVFHDFYAERAGLLDQLTNELGFAPDLIGTRGSGATTVRVSLYRRTLKDPSYLSKKKVVVWCFSAREFSEADLWSKVPVSR